ncbi:MAG: haloacid dehalogenase-like hydrolase [Oscillospiraceae bacterium]|nr:haloacid dehalogenase-like hydrolase [Oscillospiraceae bacterium]
MNVYDFDETVYYPDSSYSFIRWSLAKRPWLFFLWAPAVILFGLGFLLRIGTKERFKWALFGVVRHIDDIDAEVERFWETHSDGFCDWYLRQKTPDDLIISASPEWLLKPVCDKLGVKLIASPLDKHTAVTHGLTCSGREKVRRFYEEYPDGVIENFYSDAMRDAPVAEIANHAYKVVSRGQKLIPWPEK